MKKVEEIYINGIRNQVKHILPLGPGPLPENRIFSGNAAPSGKKWIYL